MAMGVVSDSDFNAEAHNLNIVSPLKNPSNKSQVSIVDENRPKVVEAPIEPIEKGERGRGNNPHVPNSLRNLIGQTAITDGRSEALQLAKNLGISSSSVAAYTHGATSTASYDDRVNQPVIGKAKERIAKKARHTLLRAINAITEDKLTAAKARDLAGIAKDMSAVMKNMEDADPSAEKAKNAPAFVFYTPKVEQETFDMVKAKE